MGWFRVRRGDSREEPGTGCPLVRKGRNSIWSSRIWREGGKIVNILGATVRDALSFTRNVTMSVGGATLCFTKKYIYFLGAFIWVVTD